MNIKNIYAQLDFYKFRLFSMPLFCVNLIHILFYPVYIIAYSCINPKKYKLYTKINFLYLKN